MTWYFSKFVNIL